MAFAPEPDDDEAERLALLRALQDQGLLEVYCAVLRAIGDDVAECMLCDDACIHHS